MKSFFAIEDVFDMDDYFSELDKIKVNRNGNTISLHKPLLLLLTISEIRNGHQNQFIYDDLEMNLKNLLSKYGLRNTSTYNPQYPFVYLASSHKLWVCSIDKYTLKSPDSATRKEVLGSTGAFTNEFYSFMKQNDHATKLIQKILKEYWTESYHEDILRDIGAFDMNNNELNLVAKRSRSFVEEIMDAYERKCAICNQSIRLADTLIGIDACHLKPIQHFGEDHVTNGIALCKTHHWALDRGAISINLERRVVVSSKMNGIKMGDYFTKYEDVEIHLPRKKEVWILDKNINYHSNFIFIK